MRCEERGHMCAGRAKKRRFDQPYYRVPEVEIALCDYHARQYITERFWVGSIQDGKYLPKDYFKKPAPRSGGRREGNMEEQTYRFKEGLWKAQGVEWPHNWGPAALPPHQIAVLDGIREATETDAITVSKAKHYVPTIRYVSGQKATPFKYNRFGSTPAGFDEVWSDWDFTPDLLAWDNIPLETVEIVPNMMA